MIALIQRVTEAKVVVDNVVIGQVNQGLLALVGVEKNDQQAQADKLLNKLLGYRVFSDQADKMNLSLKDIEGGLLVVPQFTLAADTAKGLRPSFSSAAPPADGKVLFDYFCQQATLLYPQTEFGRFGADMQVSLTNDGPVTFWLQTA